MGVPWRVVEGIKLGADQDRRPGRVGTLDYADRVAERVGRAFIHSEFGETVSEEAGADAVVDATHLVVALPRASVGWNLAEQDGIAYQ